MNQILPKTRDYLLSMRSSKSQLPLTANLGGPFTKVETHNNYRIARVVQIIKIWRPVLTCNNSLLNLRWGLWKLKWLRTIPPETKRSVLLRVMRRSLCQNRVKIIQVRMEILWVRPILQINVNSIKPIHKLVIWTTCIYLKFQILTRR